MLVVPFKNQRRRLRAECGFRHRRQTDRAQRKESAPYVQAAADVNTDSCSLKVEREKAEGKGRSTYSTPYHLVQSERKCPVPHLGKVFIGTDSKISASVGFFEKRGEQTNGEQVGLSVRKEGEEAREKVKYLSNTSHSSGAVSSRPAALWGR
ncbi:hypothetical protein EYF80_045484 [Liparis tanakae]|uniref:Uncharacterized protein n=1 Tax=Liparis tanakae TaxID=230148 RepID=A0A4Z2FTI8_9TELE|nr:hypothetical protein EYF80_045484 [Liparis tanakae]